MVLSCAAALRCVSFYDLVLHVVPPHKQCHAFEFGITKHYHSVLTDAMHTWQQTP